MVIARILPAMGKRLERFIAGLSGRPDRTTHQTITKQLMDLQNTAHDVATNGGHPYDMDGHVQRLLGSANRVGSKDYRRRLLTLMMGTAHRTHKAVPSPKKWLLVETEGWIQMQRDGQSQSHHDGDF